MGKHPTKAASNIYCQKRLQAAETDYRFNSREKTAEMMNMSLSQLTEDELGTCKRIPPESVCLMAELYNAPDLRSYYCHHQCPIGAIDVHPISSKQLEGIALNVLSAMNKLSKYKERLIDIAADGQITEDEEEDFNLILDDIDRIIQSAQELKIYAEKERKKR